MVSPALDQPAAGGRLRLLLLASPLVVLVAGLLLWPLGVLAVRSVSADGGYTLAAYGQVLTSERYLRSLTITGLLAVVSTVLALVLCIPSALYLERDPGRGRTAVAVALTIPLSLPGIVIGFFVILVFGNTGVVPKTVELATGERAAQVAYSFGGLVLAYLYFLVPRVVLVLRGAAATLSQDAIDAARTLGASTVRIYTWVVLPAMRPAVVNATALALATAIGALGTAATLSREYRLFALEVAAAFTERFDPQLAATLSLLLAGVTTLLLLGIGRLAEVRR